ncbi:MAG TPA: hypothetical protein VJT08_00855 [Terriglobales bacterium]|nr:hypothetical protein [Terriglobales bacterium]
MGIFGYVVVFRHCPALGFYYAGLRQMMQQSPIAARVVSIGSSPLAGG